MLTITINGHNKTLSAPLPLSELLKKSCSAEQHVIAEVNGRIVKSPEWPALTIKDGDRLELVTIVGGG